MRLLDLLVFQISFGRELQQGGIVLEQMLPIALDIAHAQMLGYELVAAVGDRFGHTIVVHHELNEIARVAQVLFDGYVMNPWLERIVKELEPVIAHLEDDRFAEEQVLVSKTRCNAAEIEKISLQRVRHLSIENKGIQWQTVLVFAVIFEFDLFGRFGAQSVLVGLPRLVFRVRGLDELGFASREQHERVSFGACPRTAKERLRRLLVPGPFFRLPIRKCWTFCGKVWETEFNSLSDKFDLLVPSTETVRINRPYGWTTFPERPCRIHDVAVFARL